MSKLDDVSEKRVHAVPLELSEELKNIASNLGVTKSEFLRKAIRKKLEEFEPRYVVKDEGWIIYITGVGPQLMSKINAISRDIGITPNSFLKFLLYQLSGDYADNMKKPNKGIDISLEE